MPNYSGTIMGEADLNGEAVALSGSLTATVPINGAAIGPGAIYAGDVQWVATNQTSGAQANGDVPISGTLGGNANAVVVNPTAGPAATVVLFSNGAATGGGNVAIQGFGEVPFTFTADAALPTPILTGPPSSIVEGDSATAELSLSGLTPDAGDVYHFEVTSSNGSAVAPVDYQAVDDPEPLAANNWTQLIPITTEVNPADPVSVDFTLTATQAPGDFLRLLTGLATTQISETGNAPNPNNITVSSGETRTVPAGQTLTNIIVEAGGTLNVSGIANGITNNGVVDVLVGGRAAFTLQNGITNIAGGFADLAPGPDLAGGTNTGTITFQGGGGQLTLEDPAGFIGAIDFASDPAGDIIDLANTAVAGVQVNGSNLVITETNGQVLTYQVANLGSNSFNLKSDGAGGTDLVVTHLVVTHPTTSTEPPPDFNGDHKADALWQQSSTGLLVDWTMNGSAIASSASLTYQGSAVTPDSSWSVAGTGDFNGDGKTDILWQQGSTGLLEDWTMNGSTITSSASPTYQGSAVSPDSTWSVAGIGDFNGDGKADILWQQSSTGLLVDWTMNGSTITSSASPTYQGGAVMPDSSWSVVGIGDFNGDGKADILWQQSSTGLLEDWSMNGSTITSSASPAYQGSAVMPDSSWSVAGIGDFNGDGKADILWRQSGTGSLAIWLMNGSTIQSSAAVTYQGSAVTPDSSWNIFEVGAFSSSKDAGIIWQQSTTGDLVEWQMNGSQIVSSQTITSNGSPVAPNPSVWT